MERITDRLCIREPRLSPDDQASSIQAIALHSNESVPSCCLPPETLSQIFLTLAAFAHPGPWGKYPDTKDYCRHWTNVAHVCQLWRTVALNCALLWTTLPLISPAFTLGILGRTKHAPLSIDFDHSDSLDGIPDIAMEMLKQIFYQRHRLREVQLKYDPLKVPGMGPFLLEYCRSAPVLEKLVISCVRNCDQHFPLDLLHEGAPLLQELVLLRCGPLKIAPSSANLKRVRLHLPTYKPDLLSVLSGMPVLEDLSLSGALHSSQSTLQNVSSSQSLNHHAVLPVLTELRLDSHSSTIRQFLQLVTFPELRSMILLFGDTEMSSPHPDIVSGILQSIRVAALENGGARSIVEGDPLSLAVSGDDSCDFKFITIEFEVQEFQRGTRTTSLHLEFQPFETSIKAYLLELGQRVDLSSLLTLEIYFDSDIRQHVWTSVFSGCANLRKIFLFHSPCLQYLLRLLRPLPSKAEKDGHTAQRFLPPFLPALKTIELHCGCLSGTRWIFPSELVKTMQLRSTSSCPIEELILNQCPRFDRQEEEALQQVKYLTVIRVDK